VTDGSSPSNLPKLNQAISKALQATSTQDGGLAADLSRLVLVKVETKFSAGTPGVEDVQDAVEEVLMSQGYPAVAKAYILYRQQRAELRRLKKNIGVTDDLKLSVNAVRVLSAAIYCGTRKAISTRRPASCSAGFPEPSLRWRPNLILPRIPGVSRTPSSS